MKLLLIATMVFVFCIGGYLGQVTFEPKVIIEHQYETVEKTVTEIIETEKPIGKGIVCDIFHFDNLSKDAICYEIQKSVTLKWLKETKEKYENMKLKKEYKDEIKNLSWILVDLNILPKDVRRLGKQIDEVIV